jgi:BolA protein
MRQFTGIHAGEDNMSLGPVGQAITRKLKDTFQPSDLQVIDESAKHAGHAGARPEGETHFKINIVSETFAGKSRIECHRMINNLLADELASRVHALAIIAKAP